MAELGSGSSPRSDYPGALDVNAVLEVDSPSASKTLITAAKIDDAYAAIINVQTELGTDPAGTLTNVKTYLQTEHNTDGTHKDVVASLTRSKVGETSDSSSTVATTGGATLVTTPSITVSSGDRAIVFWRVSQTLGASSTNLTVQIRQGTGTVATGTFHASGGPAITALSNLFLSTTDAANNSDTLVASGAVYVYFTGAGAALFDIVGNTSGANAASGSNNVSVLVLRGA